MAIILVACIDIENGIGDGDGNLLFNIPQDMKHFKSVTSGKNVIMGRKTWDSLHKKPLPKRKNYILTRNKEFKATGATVLNDINSVLEMAKSKDIYIIGGEEIYNQFIDKADKMILTQVHAINRGAVEFFPDFDYREWKIKSIKKHEESEENKVGFTFATYEKNK